MQVMQSMKSRIVSLVLRYSRKKAFASPENLHRWIAEARKTESHHPPAALTGYLAVSTHMTGGFPVYEIAPAKGEKRRILYLHGGPMSLKSRPITGLLSPNSPSVPASA